MDVSSVKLTMVGEQNNLHISAPRKRWELTEKVNNSLLFLSGSASTAEVVKWEPHSLRVSTNNIVTCKHGHCDQDNVTTKFK